MTEYNVTVSFKATTKGGFSRFNERMIRERIDNLDLIGGSILGDQFEIHDVSSIIEKIEPPLVLKFARRMRKFPVGWEHSRLVCVIDEDVTISSALIAYDTLKADGRRFDISEIMAAGYVVLLLKSADGVLWTTIRSSAKREFYMDHIGDVFKCIVEDETE